LHLRGRSFHLPEYYTDLHKKSFIVPSLYEYIKAIRIGIILLACHMSVMSRRVFVLIACVVIFLALILLCCCIDVPLSQLNNDDILTYFL